MGNRKSKKYRQMFAYGEEKKRLKVTFTTCCVYSMSFYDTSDSLLTFKIVPYLV